MRAQTTVLCDKELKKAALAAKISLSGTLEEALRVKLALPKTNLEDIKTKKEELHSQLKYLESNLFEEEQRIAEKEKRAAEAKKRADIQFLRVSRKKYHNTDGERLNKILRAFCAKYSCELSHAVALAESKAENI